MNRQTLRRTLSASTLISLLLSAALVAPASAATGPYLVKDIVPGGSSTPSELTNLNGVLVFAAKGGSKGSELWRSDGTSNGTRRIKDIRPGGAGSSPWGFAAIGSLLYFNASDGVNGRELWVSDGTNGGTVLAKDINPGPADSDPFGFTLFNGYVYFSANDGSRGRELWRTDGTTLGTTRVKDIVAGPESSSPQGLVAFQGKLFFETSLGSVNPVETLFRTDGTAAGTKPFRSAAGNLIQGQGVDWLTVAGGRLFFIVNENELWRSTGTQASTKRIAEMNAWEPVAVGSRIYFRSGEALWKSDGTRATTKFVKNFENHGIHAPIALNGKLFFFSGAQPWTSDGTSAGTTAIDQFVHTDTGYAVVGSILYFGGFGGDPNPGAAGVSSSFVPAPTTTLWRSDGTTSGTFSVGPPDAHMGYVTAVADSIYFTANADGFGTELWRYVP
jgi:ELWxxDGT repeat protein